MKEGRLPLIARAAALAAVLALGVVQSTAAQTISGTLMEVETDRPISLGLIIMMTADGDSISSAVTGADGRFQISSDDPGEFVLVASAFGFKETRAGVFELGPGGEMTIEFRVGAQPMPIDGLLVELQRPALEHQLVSNGYVRRLQRGLGHFITPYDIENSPATSSSDLFRGIPGVAVRMLGGGLFAFTGESVQFSNGLGYCTPTIYMDGLRMSPSVVQATTFDQLVPLVDVDAVEIYRRPSEIPVEYAGTGNATGDDAVCGVMVVWTKHR